MMKKRSRFKCETVFCILFGAKNNAMVFELTKQIALNVSRETSKKRSYIIYNESKNLQLSQSKT